MAYSKELEAVIEAALADGVLTDKERAVLHKKAQQEGIDPDELDVVIEGRLAKMKRQEDWLKPVPPIDLSVTKKGNVMKCPACGKPYEPGSGACPHCGHVFQNLESNHSARVLSSEIAKIRDKYRGKQGKDEDIEAMKNEIRSFIANFPIPSTKDDFIEFITKLDAGRRSHDSFAKAYDQKYHESVNKAKILFSNDPQIDAAIALTNKWSIKDTLLSSWGNLSSDGKFITGCIIAMITGFLMLGIPSMFSKPGSSNGYKNAIDEQYNSICAIVDELPTPTKENYDECAAAIKRLNWEFKAVDTEISKEYENNKIQSAEAKVNSYIDLLHMIEEEYIDPTTGKSTSDSYHFDNKDKMIHHSPNNKYIKKVRWKRHKESKLFGF